MRRLIKHKFIKLGKKVSMLTDLIERRKAYVSEDEDEEDEEGNREGGGGGDDQGEGWEFETIKPQKGELWLRRVGAVFFLLFSF